MPTEPRAIYDFSEGSGDVVRDVSNKGEPLNLKVRNPAAVKWLPGGGLAIRSPVLIASASPAAKIIVPVKKSNAITIEAWVKPANTTQAGPARIVTLSKDPGNRNFTLGQKADAYEIRLRTTSTSPNGEPSLSSPGSDDPLRKICGLRSQNSDLAVVYFPSGGEVKLKPGSLKGQLKAEWFNPRNGERSPARNEQGDTFRAPDDHDWALLLQTN